MPATKPKGTKGGKPGKVQEEQGGPATKTTTFRFPARLLDALAAEADALDLPMNELAKRLIRYGIRAVRKDKTILVSDDSVKEVEVKQPDS